MRKHNWKFLSGHGQDAPGQSLDTYSQCTTCGAVKHDYAHGGGQTSPNYPMLYKLGFALAADAPCEAPQHGHYLEQALKSASAPPVSWIHVLQLVAAARDAYMFGLVNENARNNDRRRAWHRRLAQALAPFDTHGTSEPKTSGLDQSPGRTAADNRELSADQVNAPDGKPAMYAKEAGNSGASLQKPPLADRTEESAYNQYGRRGEEPR